MIYSNFIDLAVLFAAAFFAATIFPAQSEAVLISLHTKGYYSEWLLLAVASIGNVLGSVVNWLLGRYLMNFEDRKWFPFKRKSIDKAAAIYQKYGVWSLLFAWVPFIGDPLTIVAGIFRTNILLFILLVAIGKVGRYAIILSVL